MLDRVTFLRIMTLICEMVGRKMSDGLLELYYAAMRDMDTESFTAAATKVVRTRKFTSLPTPADFLEDYRTPEEKETISRFMPKSRMIE